MKLRHLIVFFAILCYFAGCTVERAEEHIKTNLAEYLEKGVVK